MANVFDVADLFIQLANQSEDDQMTNLKLNKLLYYAQGTFLARTGKPLFEQKIEAGLLGPVVPEIYHKYKVCGKGPISLPENNIDRSTFSDEELETLLDVMRELGKYTGSTLVSLTHMPGTPWSNAISAGRTIIDPADIRDFFVQHPVPYLKDQIKSPIVSVLPAEWYDSSEDVEWESYL